MSKKLYTIQKGKHYCNNRFPVPFNNDILLFTACFINGCWYDTSVHGTHINKLYGFSTDVLNKSSIRVGWRPAAQENVFELYSYIHYNGDYVRSPHLKDDLIGTVAIGQEVDIRIYFEPGIVYFAVNNKNSKGYFYPVSAPCLGWRMYPYFGGTPTAPQPMYIQINER
jgi:hypothetical protein